ncbi:hypothetical protein [Nitrospira sp. Nam74]
MTHDPQQLRLPYDRCDRLFVLLFASVAVSLLVNLGLCCVLLVLVFA